MDLILVLPYLLVGIVAIIMVPFAILATIFLRMLGEESKGLLTMFGGFLMMCIGYFILFAVTVSWSGSGLISTAITTDSLVVEANFMGLLLYSLPVIWVIGSGLLMKDGYAQYKNAEEEED